MKRCRECNQPLPKGGTVQLLPARPTKTPEFWVPEAGEATGVPGMSGMGKSSFMKDWTSFLMEQEVAVGWWDPAREASVHGLKREETRLGPLPSQVTVSELEEDPGLIRDVARPAKKPAFALVTDEVYPTREDRAEEFVRAMRLILPHKAPGRLVLFVDECGLLEGHGEAEEMLVEIATTWRKEGITPVFGTQSTVQVPDLCRRQWKKVVGYKQIDDNDLRALTRLVGRRYAQTVEDLAPHECVIADRMNRRGWKDNALEDTGAEDAA